MLNQEKKWFQRMHEVEHDIGNIQALLRCKTLRFRRNSSIQHYTVWDSVDNNETSPSPSIREGLKSWDLGRLCLLGTCGSLLFHLPGHDGWINLNMLNQFYGNHFFGLENANSFGSPSLGSFA